MKLFATISILAIICLASSCEDSNDHSDNEANATNEVILRDDRSDEHHPQAPSTQRQEPGPTNTFPETVHTNNINYCISDGYVLPQPPVSRTNNESTIVMYDENGLLVYHKVIETEATQYSDASTYSSERIVIDIFIRSDGATNTDTTVTHDRVITLYDGVGVTAMLLQHYTNNTEDVRQFTGYIYCSSNDAVRISENRYNRIMLQLGI